MTIRNALRRATALPLLAAALAGCDGLTDVSNPNNVLQEDVEQSTSAAALANGTLARLGAALSWVVRDLAPASDETVWVGSWDATRELQNGNLGNFNNQDVTSAYDSMSVARFLADEAIRLTEGFQQAGTLTDARNLARSYLYGGIVYASIGDAFDDFVISTRSQAAAPVGEANMHQMYDRAVAHLNKGVALSQSNRYADLELATLAMRARAKYAKALWGKLNPPGSVGRDPLVNDAGAVADAQAFFARNPAADYMFRLAFSGSTFASTFATEVNVRREQRLGPDYATPDATGKTVTGARLRDPISNVVEPAIAAVVTEYVTTREYAPLTVVSARELRLILAEAALARGDNAEFTNQINRVRALRSGLTPYSGQIPALDMLKYERRANLFLYPARRLADMYRFGIRSPNWLETSDAFRRPGTFLPIGQTERLSNCHFTQGC